MRNTFQEQLEQLNVELIKMGALCEEAISAATKAYLEGDRELGKRTGRLEQEIDNKERDIEGQCMKLLLRQQPVAGDLRTVSAAMRMISDMERIGDQALDIAEIARDIAPNHLESRTPMEEMAREAYAGRLPLKAGARDFLQRANEAGVRCAVLTSCIPDLCRAALEAHGLSPLLERVLTTA